MSSMAKEYLIPPEAQLSSLRGHILKLSPNQESVMAKNQVQFQKGLSLP
jgi:hypothetical protein